MMLIITSNSDQLCSDVNISDLEWSSTFKIRDFSVIFAMCGCNADFKSELRQMDGKNQDKLRTGTARLSRVS